LWTSKWHSPVLRIGPQQYRIEEDLFFWQPHGEVGPDHARGVVAVVLEIHKRHGRVLYLLDGRDGKPLGPDTRRIVVDSLRPLRGSLAITSFSRPPRPRRGHSSASTATSSVGTALQKSRASGSPPLGCTAFWVLSLSALLANA